jgi:putative Ca2+/H+ antiporter (TMEM165/GDT1 family)
VDLAVVLTTFVVIFPAELPDKSLFASVVFAARFRPLPVLCRVAAAFAVHVSSPWPWAACSPCSPAGRWRLSPFTVGRGLVQRVPTRLVRRFTGVVLAVLAVVTLIEAARA